MRVEIQDLLGTVGRDAWGVLDEEAVPRLAVFVVWPDLTGLEAGFGEHERSRKVVPQCVAHEVEFLQFIPGCGQDVPGERSPWRGTLLNDATIGILDPYAVWREVPGSRLATERRDRDNRPVSLETQCRVAQAVRKPLEPPQPAANGHLELEGFDLPPSRHAAVRFKGAAQQIFHAVSLAMSSCAIGGVASKLARSGEGCPVLVDKCFERRRRPTTNRFDQVVRAGEDPVLVINGDFT